MDKRFLDCFFEDVKSRRKIKNKKSRIGNMGRGEKTQYNAQFSKL